MVVRHCHARQHGADDSQEALIGPAEEQIAVGRFTIGKLEATRLTSLVRLDGSKVEFRDLRADGLGGRHLGDWKMDAGGKVPQYSGSGKAVRKRPAVKAK